MSYLLHHHPQLVKTATDCYIYVHHEKQMDIQMSGPDLQKHLKLFIFRANMHKYYLFH